MDLHDTPQEAEFRAEVRSWLDANAPKHLLPALLSASFGKSAFKGDEAMRHSREWQAKKFDAGWACLHWPKKYGGREATPIQRIIWNQEEGAYRDALGRLHHRPRHGGADADGLRLGGAEAAPAAADGARRRDLVPALQRARCGLRPRRHPHPLGARRRRLGGQRPEDLDLGRAALEVRDPGDAQRLRAPQAQGPHLLLDRHGVAGRRGPTRSSRSRASRSSTRSSSPTCASPTRNDSAKSAPAGRSRSPR